MIDDENTEMGVSSRGDLNESRDKSNIKYHLMPIVTRLATLISESFPDLYVVSKVKSTLKQDISRVPSAREINIDSCKFIYFILNDIIKTLNELSALLDAYKDDEVIFYFIEDVKSDCKELMTYLNMIGLSAYSEQRLKDKYYTIEYKLYKIMAFVEILLEVSRRDKISDLESATLYFQEEFIAYGKGQMESYEKRPKMPFWILDREVTGLFSMYVYKMVKILTQYYFYIRSSPLNIKNLVSRVIFKSLYHLNEVRLAIDIKTGIIYDNPQDVINEFSLFVVSLNEVFGYMTQYFKTTEDFSLKVTPAKNVRVFVSKNCPYCRLFFKNKLYQKVQEQAAILNIGVQIYDKDASKENQGAHLFFYVPRIPSMLFPQLHNNYKRHPILVYEDGEKGNFEESIREMNTYFFGPTYNMIFTRRKNLEKIIYIKEIFNIHPILTLDEILNKLGDDINSQDFVRMLIDQEILFTEDLLPGSYKKFQLNLDKLNNLERNIKINL